MKKIFLSFGFIALFATYAAITRGDAFAVPSQQTVADTTTTNANQTLATSNGTQTPPVTNTTPVAKSEEEREGGGSTRVTTPVVATPAKKPAVVVTTPVAPPVTKPKGQYVDGTYTGSVADAYYGSVQVDAVISGGRLTDVTFLQYPNDRQHSAQLSQYATPILRQEAISAQSANVDIVSGATATSQAFQESLGVALRAALNS